MTRRLLIFLIVHGLVSWVSPINSYADFFLVDTDMAIDADGSLYVLDSTYDPNTHRDFLTIKYDNMGRELWARRFDGPVHGHDTVSAVTADDLGNVYVTGCCVDLREDANDQNSFAYATIKYDKNGKQLWVEYYKFSKVYYLSPTDIAVDSEGNAYITGSVTIKYDKNGRQVWKVSSPGEAIEPDGSGNVYVVGGRSGFGTFKYAPDGKLLWGKTYSDDENSFSVAEDLTVDDKGEVCVLGYSGDLDEKYSDFVTIKYNTSGKQKWLARYRELGKKELCPVGSVLDDAGNVYITGYVNTPARQPHGYGDSPTPLKVEFVTIKYDSKGKEQWVAKYEGAKHRDGYVDGLAVDRARNIYVSGSIEHPQIRHHDFGVIVKYDSNGKEKWVTHFEYISETAKILSPSYSPAPDKKGAKWFETRRAARKAALLSRIRKSSDLNAEDEEGYTPLEQAASEGYADIVKMLIRKGAKVTDGSLWVAVIAGQADVVKILAKTRGEITADSPGVFEALTLVEEPPVVKALLEAGLDASAPDKNGRSLLVWPVDYGHTEIVKLLLDAGADANARNQLGEPLVHEALESNDVDIVKAFLDAGVSVNSKNKFGESLLENAVDENSTAIVKLLLDAGADVTKEKQAGVPLLFEAISEDNVDIVKLLVKAGVDLSARDDEMEWTALHAAAFYSSFSSERVLRYLLELGLDPNVKGADGQTPLQYAIGWREQEIAEILRKYGAKE